MASLWKHPRSQYWTACWTDETGRRRKRSTKLTVRREAQKVADLWEAAFRRTVAKGQASRVISELYGSPEQSSVTLAGYAKEWLNRTRPSVASSSFAVYDSGLRAFLRSMGERAELPIVHLSRADLERFKKDLSAGHPGTGNQRLKLVRMLLKSAREDGLIFDDPFTGLKLLREAPAADGDRRPFTVPELQRLLEVTDDEWRSLILFGLYTGQRLGDIVSLRWSQIDLSRGEISFITKKTGRRMTLPVNSALGEHLATLAVSDDPKALLHPRAADLVARTRGKVSTLSRHFGELLESAGLRTVEELPEGKTAHDSRGIGRSGQRKRADLSFHCLRHTARSLLESAGIPLATAMAMLGHSDTASSIRYATVDMQTLRKAAEVLALVTTPGGSDGQ